MNFIQFTKCAGVALGGTFFPLAGDLFAEKNKKKGCAEAIKEKCLGSIVANLIGSTAPAAVANLIDAYLHPYIASNKHVQYGLTALEGSGLSLFVLSSLNENTGVLGKITKTFGELIEPSMSKNSLETKALVLGAAAQAVAFKYILSDSEETLVELAPDGALEPIL